MLENISIKKLDAAEQVVFGEVYAPIQLPDSDGDYMTAEEIKKMAYSFMSTLNQSNIVDVNHDGNDIEAVIVESFIAREDDTVFIPHSWVVGIHVKDTKTWEAIEKGELNGFSMQSEGYGETKELEIELPITLRGETMEAADHTHTFLVKFDENGKFLGGSTDTVNDHYHPIIRGTVTDDVEGHNHKFSFVELLNHG